MDFTKIKPVSFTRRPADQAGLVGLTTRQMACRQAMLAEADKAMLAEADELLQHGLKIGVVCQHLRIAMLSFNSRNTYDLEQEITCRRRNR
jgi:hypothetical protein